jgi:hypothetical protein
MKKRTILFIASDPSDATRLRLGQEVRDIRERLQLSIYRGRFSLVERFSMRPKDITQAIFDIKPHIIHFSGHGLESGELCFENELGEVQPVNPEALGKLFELISNDLECVVLNACYSNIQANKITEYVNCVIGIDDSLTDNVAIAFSVGFYKALGAGRTIEDAYKFGVIESNLIGIPPSHTPILHKRQVVSPTLRAQPSSTIKLNSDQWIRLFDSTYDWLLKDQLESGGWGQSENIFTQRITGKELSHLEKGEGGLISTFLSLRALKHYEKDTHNFTAKKYSRNALSYLLKRQTRKGGFGRFVESRSGIEIHPSLRHTAYAISSLMDLRGSPKAIIKGAMYLKENLGVDNILDDSTPSLAAAGIIYAINKFSTFDLTEMFTLDEERKFQIKEWAAEKNLLMRTLIELSSISDVKPFWVPYGHHPLRVFETALVTIELLPDQLPAQLNSTIIDILTTIIDNEISGGIPYGPGLKTPDMGVSSLMLYVLRRRGFLENHHVSGKFIEFAEKLAYFILKEYDNNLYRLYTQCDSFSNFLLLSSNPA